MTLHDTQLTQIKFKKTQTLENENFIAQSFDNGFYVLDIVIEKANEKIYSLNITPNREANKFLNRIEARVDIFKGGSFNVEIQTTSFGSLKIEDYIEFMNANLLTMESAKEIEKIINEIQNEETEEKTEEQLLMEYAKEDNGVFTIEKKKSAVKSKNGLTEKEQTVLKAMYNNTEELGLPIYMMDIEEETGYSKRTIVGVFGSLNKKGYAVNYSEQIGEYQNFNEQMLTEEGYKLASEL